MLRGVPWPRLSVWACWGPSGPSWQLHQRRAGTCPVTPGSQHQDRGQGPESHRHTGVCAQEEMPHTPALTTRGGSLPGAGSGGPLSCLPLAAPTPARLAGKAVRPPDIVPPLLCSPSRNGSTPRPTPGPGGHGEPWDFPFSCPACAPWGAGRGWCGVETEMGTGMVWFPAGRGSPSLPTSHFPLIPI